MPEIDCLERNAVGEELLEDLDDVDAEVEACVEVKQVAEVVERLEQGLDSRGIEPENRCRQWFLKFKLNDLFSSPARACHSDKLIIVGG